MIAYHKKERSKHVKDGGKDDAISTDEDLKFFIKASYPRAICADLRNEESKVDIYKETRRERVSNVVLTQNRKRGTLIPKGALFLKEPMPYSVSQMYAAHTFGGEEWKTLVLQFFERYQNHHFNLELTQPIKTSEGHKEYVAMTSLFLKPEGKATIEYGARSLSNSVAAALRAHEARQGPNPHFIEDLHHYGDNLDTLIKPYL